MQIKFKQYWLIALLLFTSVAHCGTEDGKDLINKDLINIVKRGSSLYNNIKDNTYKLGSDPNKHFLSFSTGNKYYQVIKDDIVINAFIDYNKNTYPGNILAIEDNDANNKAKKVFISGIWDNNIQKAKQDIIDNVNEGCIYTALDVILEAYNKVKVKRDKNNEKKYFAEIGKKNDYKTSYNKDFNSIPDDLLKVIFQYEGDSDGKIGSIKGNFRRILVNDKNEIDKEKNKININEINVKDLKCFLLGELKYLFILGQQVKENFKKPTKQYEELSKEEKEKTGRKNIDTLNRQYELVTNIKLFKKTVIAIKKVLKTIAEKCKDDRKTISNLSDEIKYIIKALLKISFNTKNTDIKDIAEYVNHATHTEAQLFVANELGLVKLTKNQQIYSTKLPCVSCVRLEYLKNYYFFALEVGMNKIDAKIYGKKLKYESCNITNNLHLIKADGLDDDLYNKIRVYVNHKINNAAQEIKTYKK